ncbi:uncharacterized protein F4812DRAFT_458055 [Daldinia caldariorum]|uniref:uncharacterized protein n=1 Tax=Daldinia caldariorum TaxID=326644 RepID=UPI002008C982|nr:uncharacterized protein F4812DRAFT_458055 [Daldinia caldariorum]KAI1469519.1 hypothetical protein F4812DRAFT_458055 [Daldinia caldariorum]
MAQNTTYATQTKSIAIPTPSKKNTPSQEVQIYSFEVGSPAYSDCESALDEDENAYDMYHIPSHHRRNALSFEDGFEFPTLEVAKAFAGDIRDKTILVTSINVAVIGSATVQAFTSQSPAHIILASHTPSEIRESIDKLKVKLPNVDYRSLILDLSTQRTVTAAASWDDVPTIDIIVNSASFPSPRPTKMDWKSTPQGGVEQPEESDPNHQRLVAAAHDGAHAHRAESKRLYKKHGILSISLHPGITNTEIIRDAAPDTKAMVTD